MPANISGTPKGLDSAISIDSSSKNIDQIASYLDDLLKELNKAKSYKTTSKDNAKKISEQIKSLEKQRKELEELQKTTNEVLKKSVYLDKEQLEKYQREFQKDLLTQIDNLQKTADDMDSISANVVDKSHKAGKDFQKTLGEMSSYMKDFRDSFDEIKKDYTRNQEIDEARKKLKEQIFGREGEGGFLREQGLTLLRNAGTALGPFSVLVEPLLKNFSLLTTAFSKKKSPTRSSLLKDGGTVGAAAVYTVDKLSTEIAKTSDENSPLGIFPKLSSLLSLIPWGKVLTAGGLIVTIGAIAYEAWKTWDEYESGKYDPVSKGEETGAKSILPVVEGTIEGLTTLVWGGKEGVVNNWDPEHSVASFLMSPHYAMTGAAGSFLDYSSGYYEGLSERVLGDSPNFLTKFLSNRLLDMSTGLLNFKQLGQDTVSYAEDLGNWAESTRKWRYTIPLVGPFIAAYDYEKEQKQIAEAAQAEELAKSMGMTTDPMEARKEFLAQTNNGNELILRDSNGQPIGINPNYKTGMEFLYDIDPNRYDINRPYVPIDEVLSQDEYSAISQPEEPLVEETTPVVSDSFEENLFVILNEMNKKTSGSVTNTFSLAPNFDFSNMRL